METYYFQETIDPKKRRNDEAGSSEKSLTERLLTLEEEITNIRARLDSLTTTKKQPRRNTLQGLDAKLSMILELLSK